MDLRNNLIVCLGSPMIDVTARVPNEFLRKYNLGPNNATFYNESNKEIFEDLQKFNPTYTVGGSITHAVKSLQKSLKYPGVCCYIGAIGKDDFGREIEKQLKDDEINVLFEKVDGESSSKCAVLLFEDNRSFVTDLGASRYLSEAFIAMEQVKHVIRMGRYYYVSAFFFRISYSIVNKLCTHAKLENKTFILNIGAPFLCNQYLKEFKDLLPNVNILVGNREESTQLAKLLGCTNENIDSIASYLYNYSSESRDIENFIIVTGGNEPVILSDGNGIKKFDVPILRNEGKLNTSGAGDYFVGGFIASFILKKSIEDCIQAGILSSCDLIEQNS